MAKIVNELRSIGEGMPIIFNLVRVIYLPKRINKKPYIHGAKQASDRGRNQEQQTQNRQHTDPRYKF